MAEIPDAFPEHMDLANRVVSKFLDELGDRGTPELRAKLETQIRASAESLLAVGIARRPMRVEAATAREAEVIGRALESYSAAVKPVFTAVFLRLLELEASMIVLADMRRP